MPHAAATVRPVTIPGNDHETCPAQNERESAIQYFKSVINIIYYTLQNINFDPLLEYVCGSSQWYQVASLNMSDPSQQCPPAWREYNTNGVRACGISSNSSGSCPGISYAPSRQYSRVCVRVIGYQIGSTDAFGFQTRKLLDSYYVYGVSITHGIPRNHIWTYAAGLTEGGYHVQSDNCPCSNPSHPGNAYPPPFVGDNYYCESGNPTTRFVRSMLYPDDPLWDSEQCEGQCCSNGKSPPWFSVELPNSKTDDIEVRICSSAPDIDNTPIQLLELYIH